MKERELQNRVAEVLDLLGLLWCHCPNEGKRSPIAGANLKRAGLKRGVPDILIFTEPRVAIELKVGKRKPTPTQTQWLCDLNSEGWHTAICRSVAEVVTTLMDAGHKRVDIT